MEDTQRLKSRSDNIPICHKNLSSKTKIVNFEVDREFRVLSNTQKMMSNGHASVCYKHNTLMGFILVILLISGVGSIAYSFFKRDSYFDFKPVHNIDDKTSSEENKNIHDNSNLANFIEISIPIDEIQSVIPNYSKYRVRRDILNPKMKIENPLEKQNYYAKRQTEMIIKKNVCKEYHEYCQKSLDAVGTANMQLREYLTCLECRRIEQHDVIENNQSNSPNTNRIFNTHPHNKLNDGSQILDRVIKNEMIPEAEKTLDFSTQYIDIAIPNAPPNHNFQLPRSIQNEDVLTGPDSSNEVYARDNRNIVNEKMNYARFSDPTSTQLDHVNAEIPSGRTFYQPEQIFDTKPPVLPTAETIRTSQQVQLMPTMSVLPYPVCFYSGIPPTIYPQLRQSQLPIMHQPVPLNNNYPLVGSANLFNNTQTQSQNYIPGQAQGFIPFQSTGYQPSTYPFRNVEQLLQQPVPGIEHNNEKVEPTQFTSPSNADPNHAGSFYCTYMPRFQLPTIPGDYQRFNGPVNDIQDKQTHNPPQKENTLRTSSENSTPPNITSTPKESTFNCKTNYLQCLDKSLCISKSLWCDSRVDCPDASDETRCSCKDRIAKIRLCDGYFDCPRGEDELGCHGCSSDTFHCEDWSKQNPDGNCLKFSQRCDGLKQCINGRDETDCSTLMNNHAKDDDEFTVGYVSGYLYKNHQGRWYPVCSLTKEWAIESCATEMDTATSKQLKMYEMPVPVTQKGPYIIKELSGQIAMLPSCDKAIFVKCPRIPCGTRVTSDYDRSRSQSKFEDILVAISHSNFTENQTDSNNSTESKKDELLKELMSNQNLFSIDSRIVGGRASQPKAWPSIVAIYKDGSYKCGGVILDKYWIATAAHCLEKYQAHYYRIHAGILRRFSFSPTTQTRQAEFIIIHPEYYPLFKTNDLGLIKLNEPLKFNRWVRPICLPENVSSHGPTPGEMCMTIGWGSVNEYGPESDHLREVEVPIAPKCTLPSDQTDAVICAGLPHGGRDACQGDSGGPLMCRLPGNDDRWYTAGIVSHGTGCARPDEFGAYTNISRFTPWIHRTIHNSQAPRGPKPLAKCPGFSCENGLGKCLPIQRRCDKKVDCVDAEDELNCPQSRTSDEATTIPSNAINTQTVNYQYPHNTEVWIKKTNNKLASAPVFTEPTLTTMNPKDVEFIEDITTIEPSWMADDIISDVPSVRKQPSHFTCTSLLQTIDLTARCNKVIDCEDGTDEVDCTCKDILRNIYPTAICNGRVNCYDLTDEHNCSYCKEDEFICIRSGTCIPLSKKCDNNTDCPLGEDELDCFALFIHPMLDADKRPVSKIHGAGIIVKEVDGVWRPYCSTEPFSDNNKHVVDQICKDLGFKGMSWLNIAKRPNLTLLNGELEDVSEFVVLGSNSIFELSVQNETSDCRSIITECRKALISPSETYVYDNIPDGNSTYMWPWQGAILVEGKYHCPAILLDNQWFITSLRCTENIDLNINTTTIIAGMSPTYNYVPGPYEETRNVTAIENFNEFQVSLLNVDPYSSSRFIQPIFAEKRFSTATIDDECFAIGTDQKFNSTTIPLRPVPDNCPGCERCFRKKINVDKCADVVNDDWSGIVTCRGPGGWYPAAAFHEKDMLCGFETKQSLMSIDHMFPHLLDKMDLQYQSQSNLPFCDGIRCERGKCIPWNKVCDGIQDCGKGEDELTLNYCEEKRNLCKNSKTIKCECTKSELKCGNGECVPKEMFCDGKQDCSDGTDEPAVCNCGEYLKLTHPERVCDNIRHCYDKTDENKCPCTDTSFKCLNSNNEDQCIPKDFICDDDQDCMSGEDEKLCRKITNNPKSADFAGEILRRTWGVWHTECFPTPIKNDSQAREICQSFGHGDGKIVTSIEAAPHAAATQVEIDKFFMIILSKKWAITTRGNKPLVTVVPASEECNRAFVKCL